LAALREVMAWLAHEHGLAAVLDLAEELAVDLAEALEAIAAVEQRDAVEVVVRWFHDQPAPGATGFRRGLGAPRHRPLTSCTILTDQRVILTRCARRPGPSTARMGIPEPTGMKEL
jgi:hypothetical protein